MLVDFILFILVLGSWLVLDIYEDYFYIIFNNAWHKVDAAFRVMMSGWLFYKQFGAEWYALSACLLWLAVYWIIFDAGLNKKRGLKWDYIGNHSYMDKWLSKLSLVQHIHPFKLKMAVFSLFLSSTIIACKSQNLI